MVGLFCLSQTCQPCDSDHTEMVSKVDTAGVPAFCVLHASAMMDVPDVCELSAGVKIFQGQ